jgi:hypothetical protein
MTKKEFKSAYRALRTFFSGRTNVSYNYIISQPNLVIAKNCFENRQKDVYTVSNELYWKLAFTVESSCWNVQ